MKNIKYWYIYNHIQGDFFIKNGLIPIGMGKGAKNDVYVLFNRDDKSEMIQELWLKRKYGDSPRPNNNN